MHSIDLHVVASVSIAGTCLDVLGSLYLAYDLPRGEHGPLRLVTRAVTYRSCSVSDMDCGWVFLAWLQE